MDAVGDRDYIVEFLFWASLLSTHLRLVEPALSASSVQRNYVDVF